MRGGETKILKRGCKLGQGVGALKRGAGTPLRNMVDIKGHCFLVIFFFGKYKSKNTLKDKS